ncbi:MAG: putative lipoprotein [Oceanospirillaceae bacterium]|jgi:predicted lipoprotein
MQQQTIITLLALSSVLSNSTNATEKPLDAQRWQEFNQAAISQHIIPSYQQLALQSKQLNTTISGYCETPTQAKFTMAQQQFKKSFQSWQKIQHIQFGPVTLLMRNFGLQYWPDKKNLGGRQLGMLLKNAEQNNAPGSFDNDFFAKASVAVKGYPALERLLFDKKIMAQLQSNPSYCRLMSAISKHVAENTQSISDEWQTELSNYEQYSEDDTYESSLEAATEILKALVEPIEAISDSKIAAPLGSELSKMRWRKSESWRSEQSIHNLRSNVATLHNLYSGLEGVNTKQLLTENAAGALGAEIETNFQQLTNLLAQIKEPENMQYSQAQFLQLQQTQTQLKQLSSSLLAAMKPLEVNLGFNRRDGD